MIPLPDFRKEMYEQIGGFDLTRIDQDVEDIRSSYFHESVDGTLAVDVNNRIETVAIFTDYETGREHLYCTTEGGRVFTGECSSDDCAAVVSEDGRLPFRLNDTHRLSSPDKYVAVIFGGNMHGSLNATLIRIR